MADEERRRQRAGIVVFSLAYAVVVAEVVTATWVLVTGERWDWDRFSTWVFLTVFTAVLSRGAEALARRTTPDARRTAAEEDERRRVLRTGLLPPDADPEQWRARIRQERRRDAVLGASCTALCLAAAVLTAAAAHLRDDDDPLLWTLAVVPLLFLTPLLWVIGRGRCRAHRLLAHL